MKFPEKMLLKLPEGMLARIDEARGDQNRSEWMRAVIEGALAGHGDNPAPVSAKPVDKAAAPRLKPALTVPEPVQRRNPFTDADKKAILDMCRKARTSTTTMQRALNMPELRFRKAETELMREGRVRMVGGCLEIAG